MKSIILCLLMVFTTNLTQAGEGQEAGGGGDTVILNGKLYLLDLVEAGVQDNPYVNTSIAIDPDIWQKTREYLSNVPNAPIELVARKLTELKVKDPFAAYAILGGIRNYSWRVVVPEIIELNDERETVLRIKTYKQLAIRKGMGITISSALWHKLDALNKAALIFHEVNYAMVSFSVNYTNPEPVKLNEYASAEEIAEAREVQLSDLRALASSRARVITGFMFTPEIESEGLDLFRGEIGLSELHRDIGTTKFFIAGKNITIVSATTKQIAFLYNSGAINWGATNDRTIVNTSATTYEEELMKVCSQATRKLKDGTHIMLYSNTYEAAFGPEPYQKHNAHNAYVIESAALSKYLQPYSVTVATTSEVVRTAKDRRGRQRVEESTQEVRDLKKCVSDIKDAVVKIQNNPFKE